MDPRSLLSRIVEAAFLFALAAWLVQRGVCLLLSVETPLLVIAAILAVVILLGWLYKHYRDTHF